MKKYLYLTLILFTGIVFSLVIAFSEKPASAAPGFKERMGRVGLSGEWINTKKAIEGLLETIRKQPDNYKAMLELSQAYVQEARVTGDHAYYDKASLELLDKVLVNQPKNFEALCLKATVLLSQHHFAEGLEIAKKAQPINPDNAFIYGIMCDANTELGDYNEAVKMADKMVAMRPDIRSYSRVSYLREIHGDINGAIEAMKLAVSAGYPGLEQSEWSRIILAHLYELKGDLNAAEFQYKTALSERPDYAYATAGLGKIAAIKKDYKSAIKQYEEARSLTADYAFSDELTDLYAWNNEPTKSAANAKKVIEMLGADAGNESDNLHGHYADKELAWAYLKTGDLEKAATHAKLEYDRRPKNIETCETMAWVAYKQGKYKEASFYITKALSTRSKNPMLLCRAGIIWLKSSPNLNAKIIVKSTLPIVKDLDPSLYVDANNALKSAI